ncbi:VWA domain-containing protein [Streptomyces sp. NPDC058583]|uniref:VWA domain-containing protein n=1 Tax=unclassified Streptomyces TaxID=2593676 RepID=UPI00365733E6
MGIRSMLRKVFGRDREESPATSVVPPQTRETTSTATSTASPSETVTAEATVTTSAAATVPARSTASSGSGSSDTSEAVARQAADDLVAASFDNPQIPRARAKTPSATPVAPAVTEKPVAEAETPEVTPATEAETPEAAAETPAAEAEVAEAAPVEADTADVESADAAATADAPAEPEAAADAEPEAETASAEAAEPQAEADEVEPEATAAAEPEADTAEAEAEEPEAAPVAEATDVVAEVPAAEAEPAPQEQDTEPEAAVVADDTTPAAEAAEEPQAEPAEAVAAEPQADADAEPVADEAPAPQEQDTEPEAAVVADDTTPAAEAAAEPQADEAAAEPEAEHTPEPVADKAPAPEPEFVAAAAEPATEPEAPATEAAVVAVSGDSLPPHLVDAHRAAAAQLEAQGLAGARAAVYLVVDRSGSMRGYFKDGSVQRLAEQVTALAAHLDEDATVTTVFFSTDIDGTVDLTPADLTPTRIDEVNATLGRLGRTNYHRAVEEVLAHHEKADPTRTALVVFQTDGAPESKTAATQALAEAAERPLHWRFVAWGEEDNKAFDYLRKLEGTPRTGTYFAGVTPVETAHGDFYRGLLDGLAF